MNSTLSGGFQKFVKSDLNPRLLASAFHWINVLERGKHRCKQRGFKTDFLSVQKRRIRLRIPFHVPYRQLHLALPKYLSKKPLERIDQKTVGEQGVNPAHVHRTILIFCKKHLSPELGEAHAWQHEFCDAPFPIRVFHPFVNFIQPDGTTF